jgi:demethylmenaquinone methyltransferase/2-methoxy-6-polyprenyl-1,4-benzoquinol methylase
MRYNPYMRDCPTADTKSENHELFAEIAPRYDFLNHLLSLNIDRLWRKKLVFEADPRPDEKILDVCTGTGDIAIRFARNGRLNQIVGIDLTDEMLRIASRKIKSSGKENGIRLLNGDGLKLPFHDSCFDIVTIGFGLRNLGHHRKAISEMVRVLGHGGRLLILEFSPPEESLFGKIYDVYLNTMIRAVGGIVSGSADAYRYLSTSIADFPRPDEILKLMEAEGLKRLYSEKLTGGIVCLYRGEKQSS